MVFCFYLSCEVFYWLLFILFLWNDFSIFFTLFLTFVCPFHFKLTESIFAELFESAEIDCPAVPHLENALNNPLYRKYRNVSWRLCEENILLFIFLWDIRNAYITLFWYPKMDCRYYIEVDCEEDMEKIKEVGCIYTSYFSDCW